MWISKRNDNSRDLEPSVFENVADGNTSNLHTMCNVPLNNMETLVKLHFWYGNLPQTECKLLHFYVKMFYTTYVILHHFCKYTFQVGNLPWLSMAK